MVKGGSIFRLFSWGTSGIYHNNIENVWQINITQNTLGKTLMILPEIQLCTPEQITQLR
jgi:hypothetical protein